MRFQRQWALCAALIATGCAAEVRTVKKAKPAPVTVREPRSAPPKIERQLPEPEPAKIAIAEMIQFRPKSATLRRYSYPVLDTVVDTLQQNPEMMVEIQGHTDSVGAAVRNRRLSARRATRVQEYLIERGVDPRRLSAVGHGEERPIADNETEEGRYKNRRVDFVILDETFDVGSDGEVAGVGDGSTSPLARAHRAE
jgi:OOP family OmpA-OmpF porin